MVTSYVFIYGRLLRLHILTLSYSDYGKQDRTNAIFVNWLVRLFFFGEWLILNSPRLILPQSKKKIGTETFCWIICTRPILHVLSQSF